MSNLLLKFVFLQQLITNLAQATSLATATGNVQVLATLLSYHWSAAFWTWQGLPVNAGCGSWHRLLHVPMNWSELQHGCQQLRNFCCCCLQMAIFNHAVLHQTYPLTWQAWLNSGWCR